MTSLDSPIGRKVVVAEGPILMSPRGTLTPSNISNLHNNSFNNEINNNINDNNDQNTSNYISNEKNNEVKDDIDKNEYIKVISKDLFGGAITISLPDSFEDISLIRQVPDHQEVFVDRSTEASLIVELLNHEDNVANESAAHYYFEDLAECNEASNVQVISNQIVTDNEFIPSLRCYSYAKCMLIGKQSVVKFRKKAGSPLDDIIIFLVVIRLANMGTDLLITYNAPIHTIPQNMRQSLNVNMLVLTNEFFNKNIETLDEAIDQLPDKVSGIRINTQLDSELDSDNYQDYSLVIKEDSKNELPNALTIFKIALHSFFIVDWALFA